MFFEMKYHRRLVRQGRTEAASIIDRHLKERGAVFYYELDPRGKKIALTGVREGVKDPNRTAEANTMDRLFEEGVISGWGWTREVSDVHSLLDKVN